MTLHKTEQEARDNASSDYGNYVEDFSGKNCHDFNDSECAGWNTENRRCECGNRRVGWETQQDSDGMWYAYAEAY